jgi:hypothetical protein
MSGFTAEWLALREPHDLAARNSNVLATVAASVNSPPLRIIDLACGSGSTVRAIHTLLPTPQHWDLIDNDVELLAIASKQDIENITLKAKRLDLNRDLEAALEPAGNLITLSALLDLVSENWLHPFSRAVAARALPVYAALTYNGLIDLTPADSFDAAIVSDVNAHQRTDKGFGPALGPLAANAAIASFEALGYSIVSGASDWIIGPNDRAMQKELLEGWVNAANELGTIPSADIASWLSRRIDLVSAGHSTIRVGHVDFFALPSSMR